MKIEVRQVPNEETKSKAEREAEALEKAVGDPPVDPPTDPPADPPADPPEDQPGTPPADPVELKEEDVLTFIKKRAKKEFKSLDEVFAPPAEDPDPEVRAFKEFKQQTGRGLDDFGKLNRDFSSMPDDQVLREYYTATEDGLDPEDIDSLIQEFTPGEDDDEPEIKKLQMARKREVAKAKKFLEAQKEKFRTPLESSMAALTADEKTEYEAFKNYLNESKTIQDRAEKQREWFMQKTSEVFTDDFDGFKFKVTDAEKAEVELKFKPGEAKDLKESQLSTSSFIKKFVGEDGLIKDAPGYHRALSMAMNAEKAAQHFFEQGVAHATEKLLKSQKNINMVDKKPVATYNRDGLKIKQVDDGGFTGGRLKVKARR